MEHGITRSLRGKTRRLIRAQEQSRAVLRLPLLKILAILG
jgi:hypothetical protein